MSSNQILNDSVSTSIFSRVYPSINKYVIENGKSEDSRYGPTKEVLNFKTTLTNPYARCVGTSNRDINIFFLLAEALWIFRGERDVDFLKMFNSKMAEFSDDGRVFHAPYGFRLRHYGVDSRLGFKHPSDGVQGKLDFEEEARAPEHIGHYIQQALDGEDQVLKVLKMLSENQNDRRAVMSIWNTELDLGTKSKDIPCNDLVMIKVRDGKFHTTIANRSNDLHWGLPTNVFQFSFISEVMSNILGLKLGTQTHNSQSLHFYTENEIAMKMYENTQFTAEENVVDVYDNYNPAHIDMKFRVEGVEGRLYEVDKNIDLIINSLKSGKRMKKADFDSLNEFSKYFALIYDLLDLYLHYKELLNDDEKRMITKDEFRFNKIKEIGDLTMFFPSLDITALAVNYFAAKFQNDDLKEELVYPLGEL